jgi:hypothetical protein
MNRILYKNEKGRINFDNFDLEKSFFIQIRYGGGRGSGFWLNAAESMRISDAIKDKEYIDLLNQIKAQCQAIINYFNKIGV